MTVPRAQRLDNARARLTRLGIDALLVGASPDLQYLTGHNPPPLERLTLLVLPATGEASLVVPALEAPMAQAHLDGLGVELKVWQETQDPVALVREALDAAGAAAGKLAVADQLWAAFLLRIQAALPEATFTHGSPVLRALRVVKDAGEVAALAAAGGVHRLGGHAGLHRRAAGLLGGQQHLVHARELRVGLADDHGPGGVGAVAVQPAADVDHDRVARGQAPVARVVVG